MAGSNVRHFVFIERKGIKDEGMKGMKVLNFQFPQFPLIADTTDGTREGRSYSVDSIHRPAHEG